MKFRTAIFEPAMRRASLAAAIAVGSLFNLAGAQAVTISNTASGIDMAEGAGGYVGDFGWPSPPYTPTFGVVFTAPITGTLTSFTLYLSTQTPNTGVEGSLYGGVGVWTGSSSYGPGGVSSILYTSAQVPSTVGGPYTFSPNASVTAGNVYVAFLSVFGISEGAETAMPLGYAATDIDYFVWENVDPPIPSSGNWNYFFDYGAPLFSATFGPATSATPVPAALPLLTTGLGAIGLLSWRRKRKAHSVSA
jgi:hypothetical protein